MSASRRWLRRLTLGLAGVLALAAVGIYGVKVHQKDGYSDFDVYHRAASQARHGEWDRVYAFRPGGDTPFRYGPPTLFLLDPFSRLPHRAARDAWFVFQAACFAAGFWILLKAIRRVRPERVAGSLRDPAWIIALAFLFSLRFILDCFMIGQVTSVMFLSLALALHAWLGRSNGAASAWLFIPTVMKVGTGDLYGVFLSDRSARSWREAIWALFGCLAVSMVAVALYRGSFLGSIELWSDWVHVVAADSSYFDASHYGSQSVKSALLRLAKDGVIEVNTVNTLFRGATVTGCLAVAWLWWRRRPKDRAARALFFTLGLFPYFWFMPETFKYTLPLLALPVAALLASAVGWLEIAALVLTALALSLAGLDIVGERAFFALQKASVPAWSLVFLGLVHYRRAWKESRAR